MKFFERLKRLIKGNWRFNNYRKRFQGNFPVSGWRPRFGIYWRGDIWELTWRGYGISVDMRKNWVADMIDPNREGR